MLFLKNKWFNKWSSKNKIKNKDLLEGISNIKNNIGIVSLGSHLYKVRLLSETKGKSGSFRTLIVYKKEKLAIYIYGFSKNEKGNINNKELTLFKKLAKDILTLNEKLIELLISKKHYIHIEKEK